MAFPLLAVALIIGVLSAAMVLLAPKPQTENARASKLTDFNFPRSNKGDPLPLIKGTDRLKAPNTIALGGFRAVPITEKVSTGLFSSKKITKGYQYRATLGLAVAIGPGAAAKSIWFGKHKIWTGTLNTGDSVTIDLPELYGGEEKNGGVDGTITFYGGDFDQLQSPVLAADIDPNIPAFPGMAYLVFDDFYWGNSTSIEPINVEIQCFSDVLGMAATTGHNVMPNGFDENLMETAADIIATKFARLGFTTGALNVANFIEVAATLYAEGNGGSWTVAKPNRGADLLREIKRQADCEFYQDPQTALICVKLIREDYDIEDLPVLDPSNVKEIRNLTKSLWQQTINQVRVKYSDRADDYVDDAAQDQDFANINYQGKVRSDDIQFPGVRDATLAQELATRERAKVSVPLFGFELICNREQIILRPGDPFILAWPLYNFAQIVMRVRTFDLGAYDKGDIAIAAAQDNFAADDVVYLPPTGSNYVPPVTDPAEITEDAAIEAPLWFLRQFSPSETGDGAFAWALPRRPSTYSLDYKMLISTDGFVTTVEAFNSASYPGAGRLNGAYGAATGADDGYDSGGTGIIVDGLDLAYMPESGGTIQTAGESLIIIGSEIIGYETVTPISGSSVRLTNLRRGLLDTEAAAHADNTPVFFLSNIDGLYEVEYGGTASIAFRLLDHTSSGSFDVADASTININFDQRALRPAPPDYVTAGGARTGTAARSATMAVAWRERNRFDATIRYETDATQAPEAGQDNEVKWRVNGGAWTTTYVAGAATTIDTLAFAATDDLEVEIRSRRDGFLSRVASKVAIELT